MSITFLEISWKFHFIKITVVTGKPMAIQIFNSLFITEIFVRMFYYTVTSVLISKFITQLTKIEKQITNITA